jgi:L-2-hydroxyglutarate oxidase LhgO
MDSFSQTLENTRFIFPRSSGMNTLLARTSALFFTATLILSTASRKFCNLNLLIPTFVTLCQRPYNISDQPTRPAAVQQPDGGNVEQADVVVIGAGVVGLAIARAFALKGRDVLVLEAAETIGTGISSRNSEVVHAGLYYPETSLKAQFCVEGRKALTAYCQERGVELQHCGKLIVAVTPDQVAGLHVIKQQAEKNGVDDLVLTDAREVKRLEPELHCAAALMSPSSGIIDSHQLMLAYQGDVEASGGVVLFHAPVVAGKQSGTRIILTVGPQSEVEIAARMVVNSAGLAAQNVAAAIMGPHPSIPPLHLAKGNYFALSGQSPFKRLVYPMPEPGGLGIHFTLDLKGSGRFGPDVEWIDKPDYDVDPKRVQHFHDSIRRYWPAVDINRLHPAYAGIRPKVERPGGSATDFIIHNAAQHGIPGLINLYGIESPGLTASLAIGEHVTKLSP